MLLHVRASVISDALLRVEFSDGAIKDVDLSRELYGEVFEPLKVPDFFARVEVNPETRTVQWPNGADFAPEFLHATGRLAADGAPSPRSTAPERPVLPDEEE